MSVRCDEIDIQLSEVAAGNVTLPRASRRHVEGCLRCQAELVQYRRILAALRAMRTEVLEPAPGLIADILTQIEVAGERTAIRSLLNNHKAAYLGGLAAATAAGAAGAILVASRNRRSRVSLAS
jgi:hypothetical protein